MILKHYQVICQQTVKQLARHRATIAWLTVHDGLSFEIFCSPAALKTFENFCSQAALGTELVLFATTWHWGWWFQQPFVCAMTTTAYSVAAALRLKSHCHIIKALCLFYIVQFPMSFLSMPVLKLLYWTAGIDVLSCQSTISITNPPGIEIMFCVQL